MDAQQEKNLACATCQKTKADVSTIFACPCFLVNYCSKECQVKDRPQHKAVCTAKSKKKEEQAAKTTHNHTHQHDHAKVSPQEQQAVFLRTCQFLTHLVAKALHFNQYQAGVSKIGSMILSELLNVL